MNAKGTGATDARRVLTSAGYGATLRGLDFSHAELSSAAGPSVLWLDRCSFAGADLRQATLDGWSLKLCDLSGANLRGASLRGTWFSGCDLTGADLRDTDLTGVEFGRVGVGEGVRETLVDGALVDADVDLSRLQRPIA